MRCCIIWNDRRDSRDRIDAIERALTREFYWTFNGLIHGHGCGTTFAKHLSLNLEGSVMNENEFQGKLAELMGEISTLPATERQKLEKLADETRQRHERLRQTVSSLQESLDYLRLSIKYLVFDLEATRRENNYLRKMLEETTGND
jgi:septal ring factor EnvC (AmiA/AmiB activator)